MGEIPMTGSSLPPEARAHEAIIARWRRRSRIVAFWRIVLPLSIFAITLALAGWIVARSVLDSPIGAVIVEATRMMTNPKFYDRDQHDRAYLITAAKAVRDAANQDKFVLTNPNFHLGGGSVKANQGVYIKGATQVILHGDVEAINSDGSKMNAQDAVVDTKTGIVTNTSIAHSGGMQLETSMGRISADDYKIEKNGAVSFRGRVHGVLNGK